MDARQGRGDIDRDLPDQRVRVRTADEGGVQHTAHRHVVDEAAASAQQRFILEARNARSDQRGHDGSLLALPARGARGGEDLGVGATEGTAHAQE